MKPFTDPFPFRNPETRSSIGEVIAEITKAELKAAEAQDLKELPGAAGEAAHKRLHKTIGKFLKAKPVSEAYRMTPARAEILKREKKKAQKTIDDGMEKEYESGMTDSEHGAAGKAFNRKDRISKIQNKTVREEVVQESHTRAQLEKMTTTQLRALLKKYTALVAGGSMTAAAELANIRGLLRAKGAGVVLDEASTEVVKARLAARGEKRGGGRAQDKAAYAVKVRLGGKRKP